MKSLPDLTRRRKGKKQWVRAFLDCLKNNGNVTQSARYAGISKANVYDQAKKHPVFRKAMDAAFAESHDVILAEAQRRAIHGVDEPVIYQGQLCGHWLDQNGQICDSTSPGAIFVPLTVKRYSDAILTILLRSFVKECKQNDGNPPSNFINITNAILGIPIERFKELPTDEQIKLLTG